MPKNTVNEFVSEPFTNKIGQVINPGDKVAFLTVSTGTVRQGKGWFDGVYKDRKDKTVVGTRVTGVNTTKYVPTGRNTTTKRQRYNYDTRQFEEHVYVHPEYVQIDVAPYGVVNLIRNRIFKI